MAYRTVLTGISFQKRVETPRKVVLDGAVAVDTNTKKVKNGTGDRFVWRKTQVFATNFQPILGTVWIKIVINIFLVEILNKINFITKKEGSTEVFPYLRGILKGIYGFFFKKD